MTAPTIKAILPYFGGKRTLAPRIVFQLGQHRAYWELFCGSLAPLLAKAPCSMETVNDLNGDVVNLARVIQNDTAAFELYARLHRTLASETLMRDAKERWRSVDAPVESLDLDRAADFFTVSWLGTNGVAGLHKASPSFAKRYTAKGGAPAKRWRSAVESIPDWHDRLRNVAITSECGIGMAEKVGDDPDYAVYADPPYVVKGAKYAVDFAEDDHARLAEALRRFQHTRVVVSYYDHPLVRELYDGWTFIDCSMTKGIVNQGRRDTTGKTKAPEVLIVNGEAY